MEFIGTIERIKEENVCDYLIMGDDFHRYQWKDGEIFKVSVNENGTVSLRIIPPSVFDHKQRSLFNKL